MTRIVEDVLPMDFMRDLKATRKELPLRTNLTHWPADMVKFSGAILVRDVEGERKLAVMNQLIPFMPQDVHPDQVLVMHHVCTRLAIMPWHADGPYSWAMTIYLNEVWMPDWHGFLIYEDGNELKAVLPKFNRGVIFDPPMMHTMAMCALEAPQRESLQIFVRREP